MATGAIVTLTIAGIGGVLVVEAMNKNYINIALRAGENSFAASKNCEKSINRNKQEDQ